MYTAKSGSELERNFPKELVTLMGLFGSEALGRKLPRLGEIYAYTEERWLEYVRQLPHGNVNYLLIAEAPPWSERGERIQYVLCPRSRPRRLMVALRNAFLIPKLEPRKALEVFPRRGVLIVDSVPFAMDYSTKRKRKRYLRLVQLSTKSYLLKKLDSASLSWPPNLLVAFAFKCNGLAVMTALRHELNLGGKRFPLSADMIAVNGAGYPDSGKLRSIWQLDGGRQTEPPEPV